MTEAAWVSWAEFGRAISGKLVVFFGVSDDWTDKTIRRASPNLAYLVDNNPSLIGTTWREFEVRSPEVLRQKGADVFVVITSSSYETIFPQLLEYGLAPGVDFCVTPALSDLRIISQIHSHDARIVVSSPDHKVYAGLDSNLGLEGGRETGGGLYLYSTKEQRGEKVLEGNFRQMVDTGREYFIVEENKGICRVSREFEILEHFGAEPGMRPHGIAYWPEQNVVFLGHPTFDKVSAFDAESGNPLFEIEITDKWRKDGRPHHWVNDLCVHQGYLYISMFSHSGGDAEGVYDGGILQVDLDDTSKRYVLVQDAWMPHTVRFFESQICYLDSMNGYLYKSTKNVIGEFPPFIRGLAYDGVYYYVGQSEVRSLGPLKGIKKLIAMTAGFYMFDDETKAAKFFAMPGVRQIHDLCVIERDSVT